jgi:hypothetical protein
MRFRMIEIRRRIKRKSQAFLMRSMLPAIKLCLVLIVIYCAVIYIQIYASRVLEIRGELVSAFLDAYLRMGWDKFLLIIAIHVLAIIVVGPLMCCACTFFITITDEKKYGNTEYADYRDDDGLKISDFLQWFSKAALRSKAIRLRIATAVLSVFWHIVFAGPPLVLLYFLRGNPNSLNYASKLFTYTTWLLIGLVTTYIKLGSYYPAYFLVAQYPDMPVIDAIRDSSIMMRGHTMEFFRYKLSFLPWYVLCAVTFGIGLIYVVPYRFTCDAMFVRYIDSVSSGGEAP